MLFHANYGHLKIEKENKAVFQPKATKIWLPEQCDQHRATHNKHYTSCKIKLRRCIVILQHKKLSLYLSQNAAETFETKYT